MASEDIDVSGDGGVLKRVMREGSGGVDDRPQSGDKVTVHYVGTLASDGSEFDSSRSRGDKFQFTLGQGQVIKAWDLGVATMRRGELATFTCKPEYAYGATGSPPKIPADATLVFEVELFDWQGEDLSAEADGGIIRRLLVKGTGFDTPNDGATVIVDLCGSLDGRVFDERTAVTFALGEGCDHQVCSGIEQALHKFKSGEQSQLTLAPQHAFGAEGHEVFQIPPNTTVQYRVTLTSFEKAKERWEFDTAGKLEQAKLYKDKGTTFFKAGKYQTAEKNYKKAVDFLDFETGWSDEEKPVARELELAGHLNLALCYIRLQDHTAARQHCDKALTVDADSVKGLFRRGQALLALNEPELAQADFRRCQQLDANNRAAAAQLVVCAKRIQAERQREKRMYSNLFERMSKLEEKEDPSKNGGELKIDHFPNSNGDAMETTDATAVSESATNGSAGDVPEAVIG